MTTYTTTQEGNDMNGICGTCGRAAEATYENQGYSNCCNDRIEYGAEAADTLAQIAYDAAVAAGGQVIELLGSWGQVEGTAVITSRPATRSGRDGIVYLTDEGYEGLRFADDENQNYGWRKA